MYTDPKTKEELVNRLLSYDFNGDFTELGNEPATVTRKASYSFLVKFPTTDQRYEVVVRKPRKIAAAMPAAKSIPFARRPRVAKANRYS